MDNVALIVATFAMALLVAPSELSLVFAVVGFTCAVYLALRTFWDMTASPRNTDED